MKSFGGGYPIEVIGVIGHIVLIIAAVEASVIAPMA
jgi:hypothetical protein